MGFEDVLKCFGDAVVSVAAVAVLMCVVGRRGKWIVTVNIKATSAALNN